MFVEVRREAGAVAGNGREVGGAVSRIDLPRDEIEGIDQMNRSQSHEVIFGDRRIFKDSGVGRREVERQVEARQTMQRRACASCPSNREKLSH